MTVDWLLSILRNAEEFKNYAAAFQSIVTILALVVGGFWTWQRFFKFRKGKPKIDLTLDVVFIRRQGSQWIITVEALLENKSKVRHKFEDFTFEICYTLSSDQLKNENITDRRKRKRFAALWYQTKKLLKKLYYLVKRQPEPVHGEKDTSLSVKFPHTAAKGSWLADAENVEERLDYGALEPGESDRWTFIACIPTNATMVRAHSELYDKRSKESQESIKVVAVPSSIEKPMSNDQQLNKLKGHVLIFSDEFRDLILGFEMLVPVAENQEVLKRFSRTKRAHGLQIVRGSLIQECIIGITKLAYDRDSKNPTAGRLIETILSLPTQTVNKLKDAFSVPIKPTLASDRPRTEADLLFWQEMEKMEVQELRQSFDQYLPELEKEWQWFSQHEEAFKKLRDKRFAHLDVSLVDQEYKLSEVEGPDWETVKEAVARLINVAEILLTILHKKDEGFDQAVQIARQIATDFWEISATKS
jgi:AbiU2